MTGVTLEQLARKSTTNSRRVDGVGLCPARCFRGSWLGYELIQPEDGRYNSGVYNYKAKRLMGSRSTPFAETQVESIQPLESGALYLFDDVSQTGLKLSPFVLVMPRRETRQRVLHIQSP